MYVTFIGLLVVLVKVPEMEFWPLPEAVPVMPLTVGLLHEYFVLEGTILLAGEPFTGDTLKGASAANRSGCICDNRFRVYRYGLNIQVINYSRRFRHRLRMLGVIIRFFVTGALVLLFTVKLAVPVIISKNP